MTDDHVSSRVTGAILYFACLISRSESSLQVADRTSRSCCEVLRSRYTTNIELASCPSCIDKRRVAVLVLNFAWGVLCSPPSHASCALIISRSSPLERRYESKSRVSRHIQIFPAIPPSGLQSLDLCDVR